MILFLLEWVSYWQADEKYSAVYYLENSDVFTFIDIVLQTLVYVGADETEAEEIRLDLFVTRLENLANYHTLSWAL